MIELKANEHSQKKEEAKPSFFAKSVVKIKHNPWIAVSIVLALVLIVAVCFGTIFTGAISKSAAGEKAVDFINTELLQGQGNVTLKDIVSKNGLYEVTVIFNGKEVPTYFTKDGEFYLYGDLVPLTPPTSPQTDSTEVPKADKPKAELYIWSYCPYGVSAQKPFAQVASLLASKADFEVVLYYAGHGAHEVEQNKIQACIQKLEPAKYWSYAQKFVDDIYTKCSGDAACDKTESTKLMASLGINSASIMSCVDSQGTSLTEAYANRAVALNIQGSPTLVINGVQASASRTAEAYKTAICSAFNTAPSECSQALSSATATTSGSCG